MTRYDEVVTAARAQLTKMIRQRDAPAISALRSLIAALENACAVPVPSTTPDGQPVHVAGESGHPVESLHAAMEPNQYVASAQPFGRTETARRALSDDEVDRVLSAEIEARREEATTFESMKADREAAMARYQAVVLTRLGCASLL